MLRCLIPDLPPPADLMPYLQEMHTARWYSNFGPLERRFSEAVCSELAGRDSATEAVHGCLTNSATSALQLALLALNLAPGAKVVVPTLTFPATATAVLRCGLIPVLADVDPDSWLLTPEIAYRAARDHAAAAVIPVAAFGQPQSAEDWDAFSADTGLPVLIDAAGAYGDQTVGRRIGVAMSFHATKALGIGEGGGLFSRDALWIARVRRLSNFGFGDHVVLQAGENAKLSEYHAAVGLAQLQRWPAICRRRKQRRAWYEAELSRFDALLSYQAGIATTAPTLHLVRLPTSVRAAQQVLLRHGIETRHWYCPPLHLHPIGHDHCIAAGPLPVADALQDALLGLPFHSFLQHRDIRRVAALLGDHLAGTEHWHGIAS